MAAVYLWDNELGIRVKSFSGTVSQKGGTLRLNLEFDDTEYDMPRFIRELKEFQTAQKVLREKQRRKANTKADQKKITETKRLALPAPDQEN